MLEGGEEMSLITLPSVILVIGVNGVGKTTSIGKLAAMYKNEGKKLSSPRRTLSEPPLSSSLKSGQTARESR